MNPKNTMWLLALAAGLFAFIFFHERNRKVEPPQALKVFPGLRPMTIRSIRVQPFQSKTGEIRVERTATGWQMTKPLSYPAEAAAVNRLLLELMDLKPQLRLTAPDLKGRRINEEYGFDTPMFRIILNDDVPILNLGRLTATGDQIYSQVVGTEVVDLVNAKVLEFIPREANDWRDSQFVDLKGLDFDRLKVSGAGGKFELQREDTNHLWRLVKPDVARADNPKIIDLLASLQRVPVARFQTDDPAADLEPFGLKPPALELGFERGSNHLFSLQFGRNPTNDATLIYARRDDRPGVTLVQRNPLAGWYDNAKMFRDHRLARFDPTNVALVEVQGPTNFAPFTVARGTNGIWRIKSPENYPADAQLMKAFLQRMADLEVVLYEGNVAVQDVVAESLLPGYGLGPQQARQYILKRGTPPQEATNAVIAELDFGSEKDGRVFARRGDLPDERSVFAVSLADFSALPANWMALRERRIWNFTESAVAGITVRADGTVREMLHKGTNAWELAKGSEGIMNDSIIIEVAADELGFLAADAWVERGPKELSRYGISDKSPEITVKLKPAAGDDPKVLTVDFGGYSQRGLRYGATRMEDGQIWVFECPSIVWDRLSSYFNIRDKGSP